MDSKILLAKVVQKMHDENYEIGNIDAVIMAQAPKFRPYIDDMRESVASILKTSISNVNIKATTTEKLGYVGRKEGITSEAVVLLKKKEEPEMRKNASDTKRL